MVPTTHTLKHWLTITTPDLPLLLNQQNFSNPLIQWFQKEREQVPVPGRGDSNPYAIWVAEIMLQQTQVTTVWPYYRKWMNAFPTVERLAHASQDQVLKHWEGLGYYSRARNLHRGAQFVLETFRGILPSEVVELQRIPGIGPYTAAAISSLAFGEPEPLLDGNVLRVYSRLTRLKDDITKAKTRTMVHHELANLILPPEVGAFNQGLMDLGRVICTPRNPDCPQCPVQQVCEAFQVGDMENYPKKPQRKSTPHFDIVVGLIQRGEKILIQRRPEAGLLGGLWEFPGGKVETGEQGETALRREILEETGLQITVGDQIGTIQHAYTHFKITLTAWYCQSPHGIAKTHAATENRWVFLEELNDYAFPKANNKILDLIRP